MVLASILAATLAAGVGQYPPAVCLRDAVAQVLPGIAAAKWLKSIVFAMKGFFGAIRWMA